MKAQQELQDEKDINTLIVAVSFIPPISAHAEALVKLFSTQGSDASLVEYGNRYILYLSCGAQQNGASTSADCFIRTREFDRDSGKIKTDIAPVHNSIADLKPTAVSGHRVSLQMTDSELYVTEADVQGICADDIDLTGTYKLVASGSDYRQKFEYYLDAAHQESVNFLKTDQPQNAVSTLAPYANAYQTAWLSDPAMKGGGPCSE